MRQFITLALCFCVITAFAGCSSGDAPSNAPSNATSSADTGSESEQPASSQSSAAPIEINISTVQTDAQLLGRGANLLKERLESSDIADRINVRVYTGASLYNATEEIDALRNNDLQIGFVNGTNLEAVSPQMGLFKLPYMFSSVESAYRVLDSGIADDVFESIDNFKVLASIGMGHSVIGNSKRPLKAPEDLEGLKLRAPGSIESSIVEALGSTVVVISSEETYSALQQNVVDGLATPSLVFEQRRYYEVQDYLTDAGMMFFPIAFVIAGEKFWDGLPEDIALEMSEIMAELSAELRQEAVTGAQNTFDLCEQEGVAVYTLTADEQTAWKEATLTVYDMYKDQVGEALIEKTRDRVKEIGD
ncbi:MAG: TRAP transporter substrate-binding protein [Clostridiales Family XIII bacterium]|jgi:TRAP-type C4-dicarboxylate transport system substrate-binding protein|nr:TRAP transporter substrate-binding protein [Clostridiales Family XIII bacterium]